MSCYRPEPPAPLRGALVGVPPPSQGLPARAPEIFLGTPLVRRCVVRSPCVSPPRYHHTLTFDSIKAAVLDGQRRWALQSVLHPDARGYLGDVAANLRAPMSARTLAAFENADGSELCDRGGTPAKMRALHSSSALAVNVFAYWEDRPSHPAQTTANIEHALPRTERKLGRNVRLLVCLCLFEAVGRVGEICAAILPIRIEEQIVKRVGEFVLMCDIRL